MSPILPAHPDYASRVTRLVAQFVDGLITAVPWVIGLVFAFLLGDLGGVLMLLGGLVAVAYYLFADGLEGGQSYAKRLFNIRVVDATDGAPCSFGKSFVRNLLLALLGPIDWIFILFTDKKQRLGDIVAGTIVVTAK